MKILYIYPHPDDESFGPGQVMSKQVREGHEVYLLTLTRGGATRQRHKYGYSIAEMGEVRYQEMRNVAKTLSLTGMTVLDLPDGGLKEMDPQALEDVLLREIHKIAPDVVATYAYHGISGFHDHLVAHTAVKRAFLKLKEEYGYPRRFAMVTLTSEVASQATYFKLNASKPEDIDCVVTVDDIDIENCHKALDCYLTFQETIEKTNVKDFILHEAAFEIFQEDHKPPLQNLFDKL